MESIEMYLHPVEDIQWKEDGLLSKLDVHTEQSFPVLQKGDVALIYVPEYRGGKKVDRNDCFRSALQQLHRGKNWQNKIVDVGNIYPGETLQDTYFALSQVVFELVKINVLPLIIGGTQDLTIPIYRGYEKLEQLVNICLIDKKFDLGKPDQEPTADGFVSNILMQRPCYLFNQATIGIQAPHNSKKAFELVEKLYFDYCRLGEFNADFKKAEPFLRNADILSFDLTSVKSSELNAVNYTSLNGFYAEQACQIAKYAGISDKLSTFGILNYFPAENEKMLPVFIAELIWYFADGVNARKGDFPIGSKKEYKKFVVHIDDFKDEIAFYKSNKSERWWMEVPYPNDKRKGIRRHHLVPCNQADYSKAMQNELPNLWWQTYQKLS